MEETVKLKAEVNDQTLDVTITESGDMAHVEIDGRSYEVKVHESGNSSYLLIHNTTVYDCRVENAPQTKDSLNVSLRNRRHSVAIVDPRRLRTDENSDRHHHGPTELAAQMPGKVVRVLVEVGAKVEKGAGIIVVEAMKMQNEMKSPRDGVVASINVAPGDTVNAGQVLVTIGDEG
jgi:biotin carboxyl carrier protein